MPRTVPIKFTIYPCAINMQNYLLLRLQPFVIFSGIRGPLVVKIDERLKTATPGPEFDVNAVRNTVFYYNVDYILFI